MPKKILLADDSITIQKVVELTFSDGDYEVIATNNGAKAIAKLAEVRPDIILSDIIMPEKNGYEVCEYVKSNPEFRHIPVILLTGTFEPFDPDRAEKAGCDAVVTKPFESQSLIHKVEDLIAHSAATAGSAAAPAAGSPFADEPSAFGGAEPQPEEPALAWGAPPADDSPFAAPAAEDRPVSWESPADQTPADDLFTSSEEAAPAAEPPAFATHGDDLFAAASNTSDSGEFEFEPPPSFDEPRKSEAEVVPFASGGGEAAPFADASSISESSAAAPSWSTPVDDVPADTSTQMIPKINFDEIARMRDEQQQRDAAPAAAPFSEEPATDNIPEPTPFPSYGSDAADASERSDSSSLVDDIPAGETKMIPKLSFDDMARMRGESQSEERSEEATRDDFGGGSAFDEEIPAGETKMIPKLSFDDLARMREEASAPAEQAGVSGVDWEAPAAAPEYPRAVPPMEDEFGNVMPFDAGRSEASPFLEENESEARDDRTETSFREEGAEETATPFSEEPSEREASGFDEERSADRRDAFGESDEEKAEAAAFQASADSPFLDEPVEQFAGGGAEEVPFETSAARSETSSEPEAPLAEEPESVWAPPEAAAEAPVEEAPQTEPAAAAAASAATGGEWNGELTDEQVDRIARRVVELMSESMLKNIAWEVIPDMAEMIVRERIRQLEAEA